MMTVEDRKQRMGKLERWVCVSLLCARGEMRSRKKMIMNSSHIVGCLEGTPTICCILTLRLTHTIYGDANWHRVRLRLMLGESLHAHVW